MDQEDKQKFMQIRQFFYFFETTGKSMTHCSLRGSADSFTDTGKWFFPDAWAFEASSGGGETTIVSNGL